MSNQIDNKNLPKSKGERKKGRLSLIWRILKWIGLAVLALLLILAIVFQAPWKVITLLAIILAACTILPKHLRKWFWLSTATIVIILIIWVFLPDDNEGWRPYTFDEELAALQAKYAVPDEENAALIYDKLFKTMNGDPNEPEFFARSRPSSKDEPWRVADHPDTAEWLKSHQKTIDALMEISRFEKCRFPIVADVVSLGEHMQPLSKWRRCAFLLVSAANNDVGEGRIDAALEKWLCIIRMAKHIHQQPTTIDMLVGIALEALATNQFNRFVVTCDATEERLSAIEQALFDIKHDWGYDLPRFLECEKLMFKNFLGMFYAVNSEGQIRLNPGIAIKAMMTQLPEDMKNEITLKYWQKKLMKASTIWAWFYMPSTPQQASEIIDAKYKKHYAMAEPDFDWQREPPEPLSFLTQCDFKLISFNFNYFIERTIAMIEGSYYRLHDVYLRTIAENRGSQILIALRRYKNKHRNWPENLDEIKTLTDPNVFIDPINGGSFVYKLAEENFTLYSKGKNNIDEDGIYSVTPDQDIFRWPKAEKDDILIWPIKELKTIEKNKDAEQQ